MISTRAVLRAGAPVILWGLHFALIYVLVSAACSPRGLLALGALQVTTALLTAAFAIAALVLLVLARRGLRHGSADAAIEQAAWWAALISLLAILANAWPVASLSGCAG